jgi:hypothetical protein
MFLTNVFAAPMVLCALTAVLTAQVPFRETPASRNEHSKLVGSWIITVTPDPTPGAPPITNYVLHTYGSDGTVISIGTSAVSPVPAIQNLGNQLSGAVGNWAPLGNGQFMETIIALIFKDGVPGGFQRVRVIIKLDQTLNAFTHTAVAEFLDLKGNVVFSGTSKGAGNRVTLQ